VCKDRANELNLKTFSW